MNAILGLIVAIVLLGGVFGVILFLTTKYNDHVTAKFEAWLDARSYRAAEENETALHSWHNHQQGAGKDNGKLERLVFAGVSNTVDFACQSEFLGFETRKSGDRYRQVEVWDAVLYFKVPGMNAERVELAHSSTYEIKFDLPDLPKIGTVDLNELSIVQGLDKKQRTYRELATWKSPIMGFRWTYTTWGWTDQWADWFYKTNVPNRIMGSSVTMPLIFGIVDEFFFIRMGNIDHGLEFYDQMIELGTRVALDLSEAISNS